MPAVTAQNAAIPAIGLGTWDDLVVIPRTSKLERLSENFSVFDLELWPQDMAD